MVVRKGSWTYSAVKIEISSELVDYFVRFIWSELASDCGWVDFESNSFIILSFDFDIEWNKFIKVFFIYNLTNVNINIQIKYIILYLEGNFKKVY